RNDPDHFASVIEQARARIALADLRRDHQHVPVRPCDVALPVNIRFPDRVAPPPHTVALPRALAPLGPGLERHALDPDHHEVPRPAFHDLGGHHVIADLLHL